MSDRTELIAWIRGEIVGPASWMSQPPVIEFQNERFTDPVPLRRGPLSWQPSSSEPQEVLYYDRESPHRKYGAGLLHPAAAYAPNQDVVAVEATDTLGVEPAPDEELLGGALPQEDIDDENASESSDTQDSDSVDALDDFEVTSPDVRHPSTLGISFCVRLNDNGRIIVRVPQHRRLGWQEETDPPVPLNGRYERCKRAWTDEDGSPKEGDVWRRIAAVSPDAAVVYEQSELLPGRVVKRDLEMPQGSPISLRIDAFPRRIEGGQNSWLVTVVMRNVTSGAQLQNLRESVLYQAYFEVVVENGEFERYPESQRPFDQLDSDEQSLALLYRESATWGIGHGCAAGWDAEPGETPRLLYADVFPAVQLPSMTPDIQDQNGNTIRLSMRALATLSDEGEGGAWASLENLREQYSS